MDILTKWKRYVMKNVLKKSIFILFITLSGFMLNTSYADDPAVAPDCTLTDQLSTDKEPGDPKDSFNKTTPVIYLACDFDNVKKGQTIRSVWIAANTNNVAPANYQIDEKSIQVPNDLGSGQTYNTDFSLSIPNNGWPVGSYHVDIYIDKQLIKSVKFTVQ